MNFSASEITINIEYTDTTGERQTAVKTISLGSGTASTTAFTGMTRQTGNQNMIPGIALLLIVVGGGIAFNKFRAKKTWKKTAIVLGVITIAFLSGIFLLSFDLIGLLAITVLSIILYWWYFFNFRFPETRFLKFKGK